MIVAGLVRGNINAERLEIRSTGKVWGDVRVIAFSTEEGAFLRGQVQMEEKMDLFPQDVAAETITPLKQTPEKTDSTREE